MRATLALISCEAVCGDYRPALPIAVAYELAHAAALIQDDIFDKAAVRRGQPTSWAALGTTRAVLTVDMLLFTIPRRIGEYVRRGLPRTRLYQLLNIIGDSSRNAALGEYQDLELAERKTVSLQDYLEMARLKTGALLAAPAACGAIVGGGTIGQVGALHRFGEVLGIAYQVMDDILDIVGSPGKTGKPALNDLRNGKFNIVAILTLEALHERGATTEANFLRSLRGRRIREDELLKAKRILMDSGALREAGELALNRINEAQAALEPLEDSAAKKKLLELSAYIARRYE